MYFKFFQTALLGRKIGHPGEKEFLEVPFSLSAGGAGGQCTPGAAIIAFALCRPVRDTGANYSLSYCLIVGRGLAPAGQFVKQIDIAAGDKLLFPFGKSEKCSIFRRREQAPALRHHRKVCVKLQFTAKF